MKNAFAARLLLAVVAFLLLALGHLACGNGYKSPTAPAFSGTPSPAMGPTPTPGAGY